MTFPWDKALEPALMKNIEKYRKYNYHSVKDLLRIVRNKRNHYHELTPDIKRLVGKLPNGYF
jgi:serine/threonine-protein kinase/endoribonuclease IRE1